MQDLTDAAKNRIDQYCNTEFTDSLNYFNAIEYPIVEEYVYDIWMKNRPVDSITTITFNGTVLTENTDYWLVDNKYVKFYPGKIYETDDPTDLEIVYSWGTDAIPEAVFDVCLEMVLNKWEDFMRYKNLGGADDMSMADFRVKFTKRVMLSEENKAMLDQFVQIQLAAI